MNAITAVLVDQVTEQAKCLSQQDRRAFVEELVQRLGVSVSVQQAVADQGSAAGKSRWAKLADDIEQDPEINSPGFQAGLPGFKAAVREAHESIMG